MPSQMKENYLKAMYSLADEENKVWLSDLSRKMGVSNPTANNMVKKLQEEEWVIYKKYKPLQLTEQGKKLAVFVIRKHRITEMFLMEKMGFGWEEVHEIAEEIEHIDSDLLFERMDEMLGYPSIDPHGEPIPDKFGKVVYPKYHKLSEVKRGKKVRLCALTHTSKDFLLFLNKKQISIGTEFEILEIEPFDKSVTVAYKNFSSIMLSNEVCKRLLVKLV